MRSLVITLSLFLPSFLFSTIALGLENAANTLGDADIDSDIIDAREIPPEIDDAVTAEQWSPARIHQLVALKGKDLPMLLGRPFDDYSLMVVQNGSFEPIPFQFDDIGRKGFPYVPGGRVRLKGTENILDENDELVFMLQDTGEQANAEQLANVYGAVVAILEISDYPVTKFAYILQGNPLRSEKSYAHYDQTTGLIQTDFYSLQTRRSNILDWSDLIYNSYSTEKSILDTMKIRIKARLGPFKATIHNRLIPSKILAVKNGPIRSLVSVDLSIGFFGIKLANGGALMTFTADGTSSAVFVQIPPTVRRLSDLNMSISLDFNELEGTKVMSALGPEEPVISGSDLGADPDMLQVSLKHNWITGTTGNNGDIIAFFTHSENFKPRLGLLYKEASRGDKLDKPERFKGSHPQIGYILKDIPIGQEIQFGIDVNFGNGFWQYGVGQSINEFIKPVTVGVFTLDQILLEHGLH